MISESSEYPYWIAFTQIQGMRIAKKNDLIVRWTLGQMSIIDFFHSEKAKLQNLFSLNTNEIAKIDVAKSEIPNYSFLAEDLLNQGYNITPITSTDYPATMKENLKENYAPPLIYTKGNKQITKEKSIAIVGSRTASDVSLGFTDNIAKKASRDYKVVVSGFAKGVDKQALDSAIKYTGQSIIVLPQGISTFKSGFKKYYKQIIEGDVLVLSTFYPKAPWSVPLAMARNPIIYGLANEIYVAESGDKGGTWSGVIDGLRKGRGIFVRVPGENEKNANKALIQKGAVPVDSEGEKVINYSQKIRQTVLVNEPVPDFETIDQKIEKLLLSGSYTSLEIINRLKLDWTPRKLTVYLKQKNNIVVISQKSPVKFSLQNHENGQQSLF